MTKRKARPRGLARLAMKYASGNASTASVSVTTTAIPIVRPAIRRYGLLVSKIWR